MGGHIASLASISFSITALTRLLPAPTPRPRRLGLPVTPATILRGFDRGNVRQLEIASRRLLAGLAAETPVLADAAVMAHLDIDSTQRRVYGHAKGGAGFGRRRSAARRCGCVGSTRCSPRCPPRHVRRC